MPDGVVLISVAAVGEAAVVAVVGAVVKRDPAATGVAARGPIVVTIAAPVANSTAATLAVAVLVVAVAGAPAPSPPFAVTIFVIALVPTAAASALVVVFFVELCAQPRPRPLSRFDQVRRRRGCAGVGNLTLVTLFSDRKPRRGEDSDKKNGGDGNWSKHQLTPDNSLCNRHTATPGSDCAHFEPNGPLVSS